MELHYILLYWKLISTFRSTRLFFFKNTYYTRYDRLSVRAKQVEKASGSQVEQYLFWEKDFLAFFDIFREKGKNMCAMLTKVCAC